MKPDVEETRRRMLDLLDNTHRTTRSLLSNLDPELVVHSDERAWRVRDVLGHLGVWNGEAVRSLKAYADGGQYVCLPSEGQYYDYNGPAADERKSWTMEKVWAEYDTAHDQFKQVVGSMPEDKWMGGMVYPWNERGTVEHLVIVMMNHEKVDHCDLISRVTS